MNLQVFRFDGTMLQLVGELNGELGTFTYDSTYLASSIAFPLSQSLPLQTEPFEQAQYLAYFDGLLPEEQARRELAARIRVREDDYFALLSAVGRECIGDVVICEKPPKIEMGYAAVSKKELIEQFRGAESVAQALNATRLSLAGSQSKLGLAHMPEKPLDTAWFKPHDMAASTHVLKIGSLEAIPYFEYLCMNAAKACGLAVAKTELLDFGRPVIASERFDRVVSVEHEELQVERLHQEDLAQAFNISSGSKYAELSEDSFKAIADFLRASSATPLRDIQQLSLLTCINYLMGNCDAHLKNLSLLYHEDGSFSLAPCYDIICTTWFDRFSRELGMRIGGASDIDAVDSKALENFCGSLGMRPAVLKKQCASVIEHVAPAIETAADRLNKAFPQLPYYADDLLEDMQPRLAVLKHFANS